MKNALQGIGEVALAAGRLYVTVVVNIMDGPIENEVFMSGFWMDGDKAITCAHFMDVVDGTDYQATKTLLEYSNRSAGFCVECLRCG